MSSAVIHDFTERLEYSAALSDEPSWVGFYRRLWPNMLACIRLDKDSKWQRHGVDRAVFLPGGREVRIDEKKRERSRKTGVLYDDFLLEEYSNLERKTVGWTLDESKICDFIAYSIPELGKCYLLPFELLRITCRENLTQWKRGSPKLADNGRYMTQNWPVSWGDLFSAMKQQMHRRFGEAELKLPVPEQASDQTIFSWAQNRTESARLSLPRL